MFYKIASVCFISKIYLYFSIGNGQPREPALCQLYRHTFVSYWSGGDIRSFGSSDKVIRCNNSLRVVSWKQVCFPLGYVDILSGLIINVLRCKA